MALRIPVSCLGARASGRLRYESTTGQIWRGRGRGKALHARCGDRRRQSAETEERTFQAIPRKVRPHAAFGWGKNSLGRRAAHYRDRRPWRASGNGRTPSGGETARCRGHCEAHIGSLSPAGGSEERPGIRHPALHVLTGDLGGKKSPLLELARLLVRLDHAARFRYRRAAFWARPSLFRPPFFKRYARRGASMIAPPLPIASTGQPSIASLQSASSSGVSGCL